VEGLSMRRVIDLLAPLGLLVMAGAAIAARQGYTVKPSLNTYLLIGLALVFAHVALRWEAIYRAIGGRQLRYGSNTAVLILVVLAILVGVNYLATRHPLKKDLTKNQRYSLSDQSQKVVQGLKDDVRVVYFQRTDLMEASAGVDRIKDYAALSPHVKAEFVDPVVKPARARELDVKGPWPSIVLERGSKRERVNNDSEQDVTNAFIKLTREGKKTVCFAQGEDEKDIDDGDDGGFSGVKTALTRDLYETKKVLLAREGAVPPECSVLVVAGPRQDLLPPLVDVIRNWVKGGGKALFLSDPELKEKRPNYDALIKGFNLEPGADVVVDVSGVGRIFGTGELTPIAVDYPYHEITRGFRVMTLFHEARSMQAGTGAVEGVFAQDIVKTAPQSWAETDLTLKGELQFDEGKDKHGPVSLAAAATVTVAAPPASPTPAPSPAASGGPSPSPSPSPEAPKREGRVAAYGDSDFASNAFLGFQGNRDLFLNTVAWLVQDVDLISIRPKEPEDQRLVLTQNQQKNMLILALLLIPGVFVVMGIREWWSRR
jgi:gliding motility-associatede transport system auxiliary component